MPESPPHSLLWSLNNGNLDRSTLSDEERRIVEDFLGGQADSTTIHAGVRDCLGSRAISTPPHPEYE